MPGMSGGEAMARAVIANGIDTVFGIPGAQIYPLFDAFTRLGVDVITPRHEQAAGYMAYGAAKSTGQPAAFSVVPGPGVLNASTSLVTAMGGCAPVLCLTGQVPSEFLGSGRGHLHELEDQAGTLRSLIKDALHIEDPGDTSGIINEAFSKMTSGRRGPVSVEMCWDTMAKPCDADGATAFSPAVLPELDADSVAEAVAAIASAKKPMIMCGEGAQHASEEVTALAELLNAPVTAFRSGRGVVPEDHDLGVSSVVARLLFDDVDLLIGVGSRLEMIYMRWRSMARYERKVQGGPKLIRIDIDPSEMQRFQPDIGVVGDSADVCRLLVDTLASKVSPDTNRVDEISEAKAKAQRLIQKVQPQIEYLKVIRDVLPRDGLYVPEVSQMGFTSYFGMPIYQPRTYITEGYQGTLGFGFPTALGAKIANPDKVVVSEVGDGGFMFAVQELATAVAHNIGVVTVLFNNNAFGNIRRDQQLHYEGRLVGADLVNPDFVKLAESFGVAAYRVTSPEGLKQALQKAIDDDAPALIEVVVETGSEVSPWEFIMMPERPAA
jgi:acetolactate synthase-1/2/3 large subunit